MLEYVNFPDPQLYLIGFQMTREDDLKNFHQRQQTMTTDGKDIKDLLYDQ